MRQGSRISVIIPAYNEQKAIARVVGAVPDWVDEVVVVDNGSTDSTGHLARQAGARVVLEPERGYGAACQAGMRSLREPDVVVFMDGDYGDCPEEMGLLVDPILRGEADLVAGSRTLGQRERLALSPQSRFGNWLACGLMGLIWKTSYTDLGPYRAVRTSALQSLGMHDRNFGWIVEMQIKATLAGLRVLEVPVHYRRRIGKSKISGTVRGVIGAGCKILFTIFRAAVTGLPVRHVSGPLDRVTRANRVGRRCDAAHSGPAIRADPKEHIP
jgi:hypothetical protein